MIARISVCALMLAAASGCNSSPESSASEVAATANPASPAVSTSPPPPPVLDVLFEDDVGWSWRLTLSGNVSILPTKEIASSPPGKAKLSVKVGTFESLLSNVDSGRTPPYEGAGFLRLGYSDPVTDAFDYWPGGTQDWVQCSMDDGGQTACIVAEISSNSTYFSPGLSVDADEGDVDSAVTILRQNPTFIEFHFSSRDCIIRYLTETHEALVEQGSCTVVSTPLRTDASTTTVVTDVSATEANAPQQDKRELVQQLYDGLNLAWFEGFDTAIEYIAANNYPGYGNDPELCRTNALPGYPEEYSMIEVTQISDLRPDPNWEVIPDLLATSDAQPDLHPMGDVYALTITKDYYTPIPEQVDAFSIDSWYDDTHVTFIDGRPRFFFSCAKPYVWDGVPQRPVVEQVRTCPPYTYRDELPLGLCHQGFSVTLIQEALGIEADGYFGSGTSDAVREFQAQMGLDGFGTVDADTWAALGLSLPGTDLNGDGVVDGSEMSSD